MTSTYKIPAGSPVHYCKLCGARIYWIETGRRRKLPVDPDGGVDADDILCLPHLSQKYQTSQRGRFSNR